MIKDGFVGACGLGKEVYGPCRGIGIVGRNEFFSGRGAQEVGQIQVAGANAAALALADRLLERGILVPAGIWAEQRYRGPGTILMVLCDMRYDEADYIRDYDAFLRYRGEFAPAAAALAHA